MPEQDQAFSFLISNSLKKWIRQYFLEPIVTKLQQ